MSIRTVQIAGTASAVVGVVTLPLQIIDLAISAQALHENKVCETSTELRQLAKNLEIQVDNVVKFIFDRINKIH
ncbi:unnamed protein product [Rotaria magnacalcarata]|nr:unnamed protein product [Rotaria magnacalcarata]